MWADLVTEIIEINNKTPATKYFTNSTNVNSYHNNNISTPTEANVSNNAAVGNVSNRLPFQPALASNQHNVTNQQIAPNVTSTTSTVNVTSSQVTRPTPIQLGQMEQAKYSAMLNDLTVTFGVNTFRWHQLKSFSLPRIFVNDIETKDRIMNWLSANKYQFNTYAERGQRRKAFLIRGLAHGDPGIMCQTISSAVIAAGVRNEFTVNRFQTGFMKRKLHHKYNTNLPNYYDTRRPRLLFGRY